MNVHQQVYRTMNSRLTRQALDGVSPGLGILPAILGVVGAAASTGFELAKPWLMGASKDEQRAKAEVQRTLDYQAQLQSAQARAAKQQQLAMLGAGVLVAGGVAYWLLRRRKRGR